MSLDLQRNKVFSHLSLPFSKIKAKDNEITFLDKVQIWLRDRN
jgi:hypothetical protein